MLLAHCHIIYNNYIMQLPDHVGHSLLETALSLPGTGFYLDGCIVYPFFFFIGGVGAEGGGGVRAGRLSEFIMLVRLCAF